MKFQLDDHQDINFISNYDTNSIVINEITYSSSLLVSINKIKQGWQVSSIDDINEDDCQFIADQGNEIVLLGTTSEIVSINPKYRVWFANNGMGLEVMNLGAACRTYNVLASERRSVIAALIFA